MAKNKAKMNKFLTGAITATMVATAVAPVASAAETKNFTDVKADSEFAPFIYDLVDRGVINGYTDGTFKPAQALTRSNTVKMLARVLEENGVEAPADWETVERFTDVPVTLGDKELVKAAAIVKENNVFNGNTDGTLDPLNDISRQHMASVIVRAFNAVYEVDLVSEYKAEEFETKITDLGKAGDAHADNIVALEYAGMTTVTEYRPTEVVNRAQFSKFLSIGLSYVEEDKEEPTPVAPEVLSVSAINASEVVVTFNQEVDAATAKDSSNYDIKVNNVTVKVADNLATEDAITLAGDKKSVIIRLAETFQAGDKYVIQTNDAIKSAKGEALDKFVSTEATFAQSAEPKLLSVTPGTNSLTIEFDRPVVGSTPLVKVDGYDVDGVDTNPTPLTATSNAAGNYKYTVAVTDATAQETIFEKGNHEVIIYDVKDTAAAYEATASVLTGLYTITDEVTVPEVKEVVAVNANRFFLRTNVPVDLATAKLTVEKGNHEFPLVDEDFTNTNDPSTATSQVDAVAGTYLSAADHGVWVIVTDADENDENPLYKGSEIAADLKVTLENFKDEQTTSLLGKKSVTNVTLNKNNTKPAIEETKINGTALDVKFSNVLDATPALTSSDVIVRDKDGVIITGVNSVATVGDTVSVELGDSYKQSSEPYSVEFKADKFKYQEVEDNISTYLVNTLKNEKLTATVQSTSTNFKYTELKLDTDDVTGNVAISSTENGKDTIEITYDVEMDDSARNVANYQIDGKALPAGSTVDFVDGKDKVRIVLPEGSLVASTSYKLSISTNVTTKEGSIIVGSLQTKAPAETIINLDDNVAPELVSATYLRGDEEVKTTTSTNKIELTFSENVEIASGASGEELDDLVVLVEGTEVAVTAIDPDSTNAKRLIITLGQEINVSQAATITVVPEASQKGDKTTFIVDKAGNKAKAESTATANTSKFSSAVVDALHAEAVQQAEQAVADATTAKEAADQAVADATTAKEAAEQALEADDGLDTDVTAGLEENLEAAEAELAEAEETAVEAAADLEAAEEALEAAEEALEAAQAALDALQG